MAELHLVISNIDYPEALARRLAGAGDDTSPALLVEAVIRDLQEPEAELNEVVIDGTVRRSL